MQGKIIFPILFYQRKLDPESVPPIPRKFREIFDKADCTFSVFCLCYLELSEVNLYLMRTLTGSWIFKKRGIWTFRKQCDNKQQDVYYVSTIYLLLWFWRTEMNSDGYLNFYKWKARNQHVYVLKITPK